MPLHPVLAERLQQVRTELEARNIRYWLQPINDEFQGEYVPAYAERLPWLSGFHASAGLGIIPADQETRAGLLVDGRYILQASQQMDAAIWDVVNSGEVGVVQWLSGQEPGVVGCDAWLHTHQQVTRWEEQCAAKGFTLAASLENPIDAIWQDRPSVPQGEVMLYPEHLAGLSLPQKIALVIRKMEAFPIDALVITQPDAIAWLLNIRGDDIPYNPLLLCYAVVTREGTVYLLTHARTFSDEVAAYFSAHQVHCLTFDAWFSDPGLLARYGLQEARFGADPALSAHAWWIWAEKSAARMVAIEDFIALLKAAKTPCEQEGMREAHRKDAVSLVEFFAELQGKLAAGIDELMVADTLEQARRADNSYRGGSFATIAGSGPNGAIVHYRADETSNRVLERGEFLLLDSGGQYLEGTTDITRMVPYGDVTEEMRDRYTRVLKGHIALASIVFPTGTTGRQLDTLARQFLWEAGCDYDHGTGHGVGSYLCVHEGPQRISKKGSDVVLVPGMVISNEPGYYKNGAYGIRIENLIMVKESAIPGTLAFETLTLVPIDTAPIVLSLMRADEIAWLNRYHAAVQEAIAPRLRTLEAREWLAKACAPIRQG